MIVATSDPNVKHWMVYILPQLFEFYPLNLPFRGNYPKHILTRNDPIQQRNGIIHRNLPEFMREGTEF